MSTPPPETTLTDEAEHPQKAIREAIKLGVREGIIAKEKAAGRRGFAYFRTLHQPESVSPSESVGHSDGQPFESVSPSIGTDNGLSLATEESPSPAEQPRATPEATCCEGGAIQLKCQLCPKSQTYRRSA